MIHRVKDDLLEEVKIETIAAIQIGDSFSVFDSFFWFTICDRNAVGKITEVKVALIIYICLFFFSFAFRFSFFLLILSFPSRNCLDPTYKCSKGTRKKD
jgi:hypothetical protein